MYTVTATHPIHPRPAGVEVTEDFGTPDSAIAFARLLSGQFALVVVSNGAGVVWEIDRREDGN